MANWKISDLDPIDPNETGQTEVSSGGQSWRGNLSAWVRGALLTGLSTATNAAITATDSVLVAFGKAQAQIAAILSSLNGHIGNTTSAHGMTTPGAAIVQAATVADQRAAMGLANHQLVSVDAAGNVGVGATTYPWVSSRRVIEISGGYVASVSHAALIGETAYNAYVSDDGVWVHSQTGPSAVFDFNNNTPGGFSWLLAPSGEAGTDAVVYKIMSLDSSGLQIGGTITHTTDNAYSFGTAARRASVVFAARGTINTSDAREKTSVTALTASEIKAAKLLAAEIGTYQWLSSIEAKGNDARKHIGMTVQRAIEVMESCGLDPFAYGFICFDEWGAVETEDGETTQEAGSRYSFRPDELLLFLARGFEARLAALEAK